MRPSARVRRLMSWRLATRRLRQHEVHRLVADARQGDRVLGHHREQLAEAVARDDALGGLGDAALGLLVEAPDLLLGGRRRGAVGIGFVGHRCHSLCPDGHYHERRMADGEREERLGEIIRRQRELSALSMRQFADLVGISNPYLSQIERGLRDPSEKVLEGIAKSLQISVDTLREQAGMPVERRGGDAGRRRGDPRGPAAHRPPAPGDARDLRGVHGVRGRRAGRGRGGRRARPGRQGSA